MIVPSLATQVTIGGHCWMGDDHVFFFWFVCCFLVLTPTVQIDHLLPTQPLINFIPELCVQVGIDDVSVEASDPCLCQCKINTDFLYKHNLSMLIYIVILTGSIPDQPEEKIQGGK